jgi:hypothetical protein
LGLSFGTVQHAILNLAMMAILPRSSHGGESGGNIFAKKRWTETIVL